MPHKAQHVTVTYVIPQGFTVKSALEAAQKIIDATPEGAVVKNVATKIATYHH